jgi:hypothetical protein
MTGDYGASSDMMYSNTQQQQQQPLSPQATVHSSSSGAALNGNGHYAAAAATTVAGTARAVELLNDCVLQHLAMAELLPYSSATDHSSANAIDLFTSALLQSMPETGAVQAAAVAVLASVQLAAPALAAAALQCPKQYWRVVGALCSALECSDAVNSSSSTSSSSTSDAIAGAAAAAFAAVGAHCAAAEPAVAAALCLDFSLLRLMKVRPARRSAAMQVVAAFCCTSCGDYDCSSSLELLSRMQRAEVSVHVAGHCIAALLPYEPLVRKSTVTHHCCVLSVLLTCNN